MDTNYGVVLFEAIVRGVFQAIAANPVIRGIGAAVQLIAERLRERAHARGIEERFKRIEAIRGIPPAEAAKIVGKLREEARISGVAGPEVDRAAELLAALPAGIASKTRPAHGSRTWPIPRSLADYERLVPTRGFRYRAGQDAPHTDHTLIHPLGIGGFAEVWLARRKRTGETVALKLCTAPDPRTFRREAENFEKLVAALGEHPNLVRVLSVQLDIPVPTIELEYLEGGTVHDWFLTRQGKPAPQDVRRLLQGVLGGLAAAHRHGVSHRDLKPDNILLTGEGVPKIADFGLGGLAKPDLPGVTAFAGAGTPGWMAPEEERGSRGDARSDVYAIGLLWYRLSVGDLTAPVALDSLSLMESAGVAASDRQAIARALSGRPESRWPSACEFLLALGEQEKVSTPARRLLKFACERCGKRLSAGQEKSGRDVACPACGERIWVPGSADILLQSAQIGGRSLDESDTREVDWSVRTRRHGQLDSVARWALGIVLGIVYVAQSLLLSDPDMKREAMTLAGFFLGLWAILLVMERSGSAMFGALTGIPDARRSNRIVAVFALLPMFLVILSEIARPLDLRERRFLEEMGRRPYGAQADDLRPKGP